MSLDKKLKSEYQRGYEEGYKEAQKNQLDKQTIEINRFLMQGIINRIKQYFFKMNGKLIGKCPFHQEETKSCIYDSIEDEFFCLSCGENGDGFKLIKEIEGMEFKEIQ